MATAFINKHITRVLAAGGTVPDATRAAAAEAWLTSNGLLPYLFDWANPAFGVVKNGSNEISKIMGLGTTWLPRIGDLTPVTTANVVYNATALGGLPAWVSTSSGHCLWGWARGATRRIDLIRKKYRQGLTVVAVYSKTHTNPATPFGWGQFGGGCYLRNASGSPGSLEFAVGPMDGTQKLATHPTTLANNAVHIIGGTFDGDVLTGYVEGVAGTPVGGYLSTYTSGSHKELQPLRGGTGGNINTQHYYCQGVGSRDFVNSCTTTSTIRGFAGQLNEAQMTISDIIVLETKATDAHMASLNSLLRGWYGP